MSDLVSAEERAAIELAVADAERASGAEIVPVLVPTAGAYPVADARGAAVGALVGALAYLLAPKLDAGGVDPGWLGTVAVAMGALGGLLLARIARVRRALAGAELDERVDLVAAREFLARDVFRTERHTGILLFVAQFERRVRVLADDAVYRAVPRATWERLAADAARAMRSDRPGAALLAAVQAAGALLAEHGPRRARDDRNELPDAAIEAR